MNLTEEARRLLSCEELRGRVPQEVADFLRMVAGLEPSYFAKRSSIKTVRMKDICIVRKCAAEYDDIPLYTLDARHDPD